MINIKLKLSIKIAILTFVLSLFGIAVFAFISYQQSNQIFKNNLIKSTAIEVEKSSLNIQKKVDEAKKNLIFISSSEPIDGILRTTKNKYNYDEEQNMHLNSWIARLKKLFAIIMKQNPSYFQMRFIGVKDDGKEIVRVSREKHGIEFIDENLLVKKGKRYYFKESIKLKDKEIYLSQIDLNKEFNVISIPHIPTLRVATPIYNNNKVFAIIIINIDICKLLDFNKFTNNSNLETYIANYEGQYLYHKDTDKTFGFEFGKKYLIQDDFQVKDIIQNKRTNTSFYHEDLGSALAINKINLSDNKWIYIMHIASSSFFEKESQSYIKVLMFYVMGIAIVIAFLIAFLVRYLTAPISQLTQTAKQITDGKKIDLKILNIKSNDEVEELATSFKYMVTSLSSSKDELQHLADSLELDVEDKTKELRLLNEGLEKKIEKSIQESRRKDNILQEQNKMASMGEMIGAIAHQWRQPLNAVSLSIQNLKYDYKAGDIDEKFIDEYIEENKKIIKFMSRTIDDFRRFFRVDKEKVDFKIKESIESVISMQSAQLKSYDITLNIIGEEFEYFGLQSEFQQVMLNLINNAKDALIENSINNPIIEIKIDALKKQISIQDNANGVPQDLLERIFEPYFTTKEQGKGTGIGLYMSKMIIEDNMDAILKVENVDNGAKFTIDLNKKEITNV